MVLWRRLLAILGGRTFLTFGVVAFLVAALLATVNLTSRYALKRYVEDQLERIPWDLAVYQRGAAGDHVEQLRSRLARVPGLTRVETMAFLRARFPEGSEVVAEVSGVPLTSPWLCVLAASDLTILPPGLGMALENLGARRGGPAPPRLGTAPSGVPTNGGRSDGDGSDPKRSATSPPAILALIGPDRAMGAAFRRLQGATTFSFKVQIEHQVHELFSTPLEGVIRLDRDELNRWLLDQTGSVSYIPHVGVILLMPYQADVLVKFDRAASGIVPLALQQAGNVDLGHVQLAEYEPEIAYLARIDRARLISGWDIAGSLDRVTELTGAVDRVAHSILDQAAAPRDPRLVLVHDPAPGGGEVPEETVQTAAGFVVDSTTLVLLGRMERIARLVGLVTLLVALPLLWMGWVLAANLSGLLMLNERRTLGLMRLRGISGRVLGGTLIASILAGGVVGGALGLAVGSGVPLAIAEGGRLPLEVLAARRELLLLGGFLAVTLVLALLVSRRLVRYAVTISPLEASARVAGSELLKASLRFGILQALSLLLGTYVLVYGWIFGGALSQRVAHPLLVWADRVLDFLGLPLFLYGVTALIATHRSWIQRALAPLIAPIGGRLGRLAVTHLAVKPHRTEAFLLVVALVAGVSLYPTITSRSFADRAERGARVQLGTDWQLLFNAPDLADVGQLQGGLNTQLAALGPAVEALLERLKAVEGVRDATYLVEALLPNFYLPGYGLRGVPLYLVADPVHYLTRVYSEPEVGLTAPFGAVVGPLGTGAVAVSPPVADFWQLRPGEPLLVGLDSERRTLSAETSGVLAFLPGLPPRTVTDRQGYVQARVDYLNFLLSSHAYVVAAANNPRLADLQLLIPRVIVLVDADATDPEAQRAAMLRALPVRPLEVHHLAQEVAKIGTDMYISLALANMRIYLVGGLLLAVIAILAVAMVNYFEDRRTLALLRIRGASPREMWRFLVALLLAPALLGIILGGLAAVLAGYGLANYVWRLREIRTVVQLLPTHLVASPATGLVLALLIALLASTALAFSWWVFRRTAHQTVQAA
jgi:hypothetical protein